MGDDVLPRLHAGRHHPLLQPPALDLGQHVNRHRTNLQPFYLLPVFKVPKHHSTFHVCRIDISSRERNLCDIKIITILNYFFLLLPFFHSSLKALSAVVKILFLFLLLFNISLSLSSSYFSRRTSQYFLLIRLSKFSGS